MKTAFYKIKILTDANSWIAQYVSSLVSALENEGHSVSVAHEVMSAGRGDFCFCLSFSRLVPRAVRANFRNTLVVHESALPRGRGWAPLSWQILEGCHRVAVTLIEAVDEVDAGAIYLQEWLNLSGTELSSEWREMQGRATQRLCLEWVRGYPDIVAEAREQMGQVTYYAKRTPTDSQLDPTKTIAEQFNLLRIVDNEAYPAFFEYKGRKYRVKIDPVD